MKKSNYENPELTILAPQFLQVICTSLGTSVEGYQEEDINW